MLNSLLGFLFGKNPDIFDADGRIVHKFSSEKWKQWNDRFAANRDYDWRHHKGTERKISKPASSK